MKDTVVEALEATSIEKDGSVVVRVQCGEEGLVALTLPKEVVSALAPIFAAARAQNQRNLEDEPFQTCVARSARVLFHKPSARVIIRFDEGDQSESNFSLAPDQVPLFAKQVLDCLEFLEQRARN